MILFSGPENDFRGSKKIQKWMILELEIDPKMDLFGPLFGTKMEPKMSSFWTKIWTKLGLILEVIFRPKMVISAMVSHFFGPKMKLKLGPFWTQFRPHFRTKKVPKMDTFVDQIGLKMRPF